LTAHGQLSFKKFVMRALPITLLLVALSAPLFSAQDTAAAENSEATLSEIGLATGKVITGIILRRDKRELIYRLSASDEEITLPLDEVIFLRSSTGTYEFIFPEEKPAEAAPPHAAIAADGENVVLVGVGLTLSDNSPLTAFAREYASALAADYNSRLIPAGFVAQPGLEAGKLAALLSAEYRLLRADFMLGLGAAYTVIPKSSAVVSSAAHSGQETINTDGYAVPVTAIIYYRIWGDRNLSFSLGAGGGALFTSLLLTRNFGGKSSYEEVYGLAPMLIFKPELSLRLSSLLLALSLPVFWAEGRPATFETGVLPAGRNTAASLTGMGFQLAVGYSF
jgi:hypothetical protein